MIRIVKVTSIGKYIETNPKVKEWEKPQDIVESFGAKAVDIIGGERAVIDIKGNHIRIIIKYQFHAKLKQPVIYVKWIGTHAAYSKLCKLNKQYTVEMFK